MLHEPVDEAAPVIDDLSVHDHLCMLNSRDERPSRGDVDFDLLEFHERDLARDVFDRPKKGRRVDSSCPMCAMDEPWSQQFPDRGQLPPGNRHCHLFRGFRDSFTLVHIVICTTAEGPLPSQPAASWGCLRFLAGGIEPPMTAPAIITDIRILDHSYCAQYKYRFD